MEKYLEAAEQVTNALLEDTAAFTKVFPHAEAEAVADDISHLAERAFRRPLTDAERKRLWERFRLAEKSTESRQQSLA